MGFAALEHLLKMAGLPPDTMDNVRRVAEELPATVELFKTGIVDVVQTLQRIEAAQSVIMSDLQALKEAHGISPASIPMPAQIAAAPAANAE